MVCVPTPGAGEGTGEVPQQPGSAPVGGKLAAFGYPWVASFPPSPHGVELAGNVPNSSFVHFSGLQVPGGLFLKNPFLETWEVAVPRVHSWSASLIMGGHFLSPAAFAEHQPLTSPLRRGLGTHTRPLDPMPWGSAPRSIPRERRWRF